MRKFITKNSMVLAIVLPLLISSGHVAGAKRKADESALEEQAEKKQKTALKTCALCTYDKNAADALTCEVCDAAFLDEIKFDEKDEQDNKEAQAEPEEIRCNLCLDALHGAENLPVLALPKYGSICGHEFHRECLASSLAVQSRCPYCRAAVDLETNAIGLTETELAQIKDGLGAVHAETEAANRQAAIEIERLEILLTELLNAIRQGDGDNVTALLNNNHFDQRDLNQALMVTIELDNVALMHYVINAGGNIHYETSSGCNMLMKATYHGSHHTFKALVDAGVNINGVNNHNESTLIFAISLKQFTIAEILIGHGADVNIQPKNKQSSLTFAACSDYHDTLLPLILGKANVANIISLFKHLCSHTKKTHLQQITPRLLEYIDQGVFLDNKTLLTFVNELFNYAILTDQLNSAQKLIGHEKLCAYDTHLKTAAESSLSITELLLTSDHTKDTISAYGAINALFAAHKQKRDDIQMYLIHNAVIQHAISSNHIQCEEWIQRAILANNSKKISFFFSGILTEKIIDKNYFIDLFIEAAQEEKVNAVKELLKHKYATTYPIALALEKTNNETIKELLKQKLHTI